jgi:RNA polymerase sigma-70 factor (ECF subfamily)
VLLQLYDYLAHLTGTVGVQIGRAVAHADHGDAHHTLTILDGLPPELTQPYQPYWVGWARVLEAVGRRDEAAAARGRAIELTHDPALRQFLAAGRRLSS